MTDEEKKPKVNETGIPQIPYNFFEARCYEYERRIDEQRDSFSNQIEEQRREFLNQIGKEKEDKAKTIKHWKQAVIILVILIGLILGGIVGTTIYVLDNYDFSTYSQEVETGSANYIGNDGDITNGETDYKKDNK